ncbi:cephalosporin hydroxylase family protein [Zongyangia hominis]|uniref:Uncharacterized protein n=1 Tax=Zongyangia hominis TaxID=2763677 RepID=A0A926EEA8_9FIRM|nr:cephalosporin hydroxylase family protein [Zongyangia hominis]MBC8570609.1 hypothetical protein [Zongyangia hominis]
MIQVYARCNEEGKVLAILDSAHHMREITDRDVLIAEGYGDDCAYFPLRYQLLDEQMCHRFQIVDGKLVECTPEEREDELRRLLEL